MSDTPTGSSPAPGPTGFPPAPAPPPWPPAPPMAFRQPARWPVFAMLIITLIAVGAAIAAWLRPLPESKATSAPQAPIFTDQQVADAKIQACNAFELVQKGIALQTNGDVSNDPVMVEAQSANARLSTISGGWYLKARTDPATPPQLAAAINQLSNDLLDLGANYLAGAKDAEPSQAALKIAGNSAFARVQELCK